MTICEYKQYAEQEILPLYTSVGWTAYTDHPELLRKGFENSMLTLAAYEGNQLLGIIRVVGDGHTIMFIQDILVFPEHQRKGIGSALLQAILDRYISFNPCGNECFPAVRHSVLLVDNHAPQLTLIFTIISRCIVHCKLANRIFLRYTCYD